MHVTTVLIMDMERLFSIFIFILANMAVASSSTSTTGSVSTNASSVSTHDSSLSSQSTSPMSNSWSVTTVSSVWNMTSNATSFSQATDSSSLTPNTTSSQNGSTSSISTISPKMNSTTFSTPPATKTSITFNETASATTSSSEPTPTTTSSSEPTSMTTSPSGTTSMATSSSESTSMTTSSSEPTATASSSVQATDSSSLTPNTTSIQNGSTSSTSTISPEMNSTTFSTPPTTKTPTNFSVTPSTTTASSEPASTTTSSSEPTSMTTSSSEPTSMTTSSSESTSMTTSSSEPTSTTTSTSEPTPTTTSSSELTSTTTSSSEPTSTTTSTSETTPTTTSSSELTSTTTSTSEPTPTTTSSSELTSTTTSTSEPTPTTTSSSEPTSTTTSTSKPTPTTTSSSELTSTTTSTPGPTSTTTSSSELTSTTTQSYEPTSMTTSLSGPTSTTTSSSEPTSMTTSSSELTSTTTSTSGPTSTTTSSSGPTSTTAQSSESTPMTTSLATSTPTTMSESSSSFTTTPAPTTTPVPSKRTTTVPSSTRTTEKSSTAFSSTRSTTHDRTTTPVPDCEKPPTLLNGWAEYNDTNVGSVAKYYCYSGYNLTGTDSVTCLQNGSWEQVSVKCSPLECGELGPIENADIRYVPRDTTHFGAIAVLQCQPGYVSNTSNGVTSRCSEKGTWTGNLPICSPVDCDTDTLNAPANGTMTTYNTTVGSVVTFKCNNGYILQGFQSRTCLDSGEWSGSSPNCKQAPAQPVRPCPEQVDSRGLKWNETQAGQFISIPCSRQNQNLSGEISRKCTEKGEWLLPNYNCTRKEFEAIKQAVNVIKDNPTVEGVENVLSELSGISNQSTSDTTYGGEIEAITATLEVIADIDYENITLTESQSKAFLETTSNLLDSSNADSWQAIDQHSTGEEEDVSGASKVLNVVNTYADAITNSLNDSTPNRTIAVANLLLQVRRLNNSGDIKFPDETEQQNFASTLVLSKDSLKGSTKYSAVIYKNLTGVLSTNASFNRENLELGSSVMAVKLDQWGKNEDFKIRMTFSNFKENVDTKAIRIISIVGCSVSMLGLIVTMITHISYWRYVKSDRVKILMNLCIALLISYGLFLGGVDRTSNKDVCTSMAVLLQYIYLVVFFLMLAEGIEISFVVLYVFTTKSRLKWILPCAWLIPAIIVGISIGATQTKGYGNAEFCWLSVDNGLIWAFVGPALLVILINFVLLVFVLKTIFKTKSLSQKSNKERTITGIRCLCVLLPLVGCTWVIGIFYVNESIAWIQYVFAVCNSLQGLTIFIFHCALNTQIRQAYKRRQSLSESNSFTRSTSNPLIRLPRVKTSQSATDIFNSINGDFGTEITLQHRRPFQGNENRGYFNTDLEMTRFPYTYDYFDD